MSLTKIETLLGTIFVCVLLYAAIRMVLEASGGSHRKVMAAGMGILIALTVYGLAQGGGFSGGVAAMIEEVLQSPYFLYRGWSG